MKHPKAFWARLIDTNPARLVALLPTWRSDTPGRTIYGDDKEVLAFPETDPLPCEMDIPDTKTIEH